MECNINAAVNSQFRIISPILLLAFAFAIWLPNQVTAADLQEAKVTQVVQDVKVVPAGAAARPVTVNETVRQGNAVQTGNQSRSELTFRDQTITRLGEKTIYNVGGGRTIELGSGQFLLYVPKNSGGAKVKMGPVTAAITGTTVVGNVLPQRNRRIYGARRNRTGPFRQRGSMLADRGRSKSSLRSDRHEIGGPR